MSTSSQALVMLKPRPVKAQPKPHSKLMLPNHGGKDLTRREGLFIDEWLKTGNSRQSALKVGYAPSVADVASIVILKNKRVMKEIRRREDEYFADMKVDTDFIIHRTVEMAASNMSDYGYINEKGEFVIDLSNCTREQMAAIQEISYDLNGKPRLKLYDRKGSNELLAKLKKVGDLANETSLMTGDGQPSLKSMDAIVRIGTQIINQQVNIITSPAPE